LELDPELDRDGGVDLTDPPELLEGVDTLLFPELLPILGFVLEGEFTLGGEVYLPEL